VRVMAILSHPEWIGALIGFVLGYIDYKIVIGVVQMRLKRVSDDEISSDLTSFERKLKVLRVVIVIMTLGAFPVIGYLTGLFLFVPDVT
jgi:hypothetical protein